MATVIELKTGEFPPAGDAQVLVVSSAVYPAHGVSMRASRRGRNYFATTSEKDIAIMVARAIVYADRAGIAEVYLKREVAIVRPPRKRPQKP